jgi:hypothetical protein
LVLFTGGRRGRQYISSITSELGRGFSGSHLRLYSRCIATCGAG